MITWWISLLVMGITFIPITILLFRNFWDLGYPFAKILGLLFVSYLIWLLGSLRLVSFTSQNIFLLIGLLLIINLIISFKADIFSEVTKKWPIILLEEILFTVGLIFWSFIKAHEPSIHGLEKFMDFGFINSILRTDYFPAKDIWLTPFSINYYYFGHLVTAVLTKISGLDSIITYNLMIATLFALTLVSSFSIGSNLYYLFLSHTANHKSPDTIRLTPYILLSGLLSSFLVTLGGNLHTIYIFFQSYAPPENPLPFWQLPLMFNSASYWYPNATRFIPFTIHEFPLYSFVVSDLHGHVSNIPFVLLITALLISLFSGSKLNALHYTLLSLLIATSLMTNVLDGPIYLLVIFFVIFLTTHYSLLTTILTTSIITIGAIIFSLPFWLSFTPFGSGIGVLCAPGFLTNLGHFGPFLFEANHCARSPLWMLAILWGFPLSVVLLFLFKVLNLKLVKTWNLKIGNLIDFLTLTFALAVVILITIPELVYVKDIYPAHYRANTVFKFGYQAFIIFGLVSGYMLTRLISAASKTKRFTLYAIPLSLLFFLVAIYPYFAVNSYFNSLRVDQGLDGLKYLQPLYPSDYQAILWLRNNIKNQPVILEAQGDSYTDYARVSANTGLPTVVGWPVHEWLWRGSYDEAGKRSGEVTTLYESQDLAATKQLLSKYNVEYVFIGALERQKYTKLDEAKFASLGKVVFQSGETKIYQLN